jgi:hypothetical protein
MVRKRKIVWLMILVCAVIVCWAGTKSFGDRVPAPYSNRGNIGAWYDEIWQAGGYFRLEETTLSGPGHTEYRYKRIPYKDPLHPEIPPDPETSGDTAFYNDHTNPTVSIPQDLVVTDWKVSGHVHFAGDM